ncbi:MAG: ATP-binding protein, partial [Bdellovibrionota bacterium]
MIADYTIDRAKEREILLRNTTQGNHTLLLGRNGVGKTHLLIDLKRELRATDVALHYIPRPVPAKETIENIYAWLAMLAGVALPRKIS